MTTARAGLEHHSPAAAHPDQATRHHRRPSKLFEKDHAYAARLVQTAIAIGSVLRSTTTRELPDQVPLKVDGDDTIITGIVKQPQAHGSGP